MADSNCARVDHLVAHYLQELSLMSWNALYEEPKDGRCWEPSNPESHLHGEGPLRLDVVDEETAAADYRF